MLSIAEINELERVNKVYRNALMVIEDMSKLKMPYNQIEKLAKVALKQEIIKKVGENERQI